MKVICFFIFFFFLLCSSNENKITKYAIITSGLACIDCYSDCVKYINNLNKNDSISVIYLMENKTPFKENNRKVRLRKFIQNAKISFIDSNQLKEKYNLKIDYFPSILKFDSIYSLIDKDSIYKN
ncbi:hypothetical protein OAQ99_06080 [Candidatus Kapabacteria bacterium]|nr:hypothetical protein [Candidatus Kapabacteria bacterium]